MKTMEICGKCAATMGGVRRVAGGTDNKVTCAVCGRRRYGGTYEVERDKPATLKKKG